MKHALHIGFTLTFLLFVSLTSFAQDNAEKIKGKWIFEKAEMTKTGADPVAMHQAMLNTIFEFDGYFRKKLTTDIPVVQVCTYQVSYLVPKMLVCAAAAL